MRVNTVTYVSAQGPRTGGDRRFLVLAVLFGALLRLQFLLCKWLSSRRESYYRALTLESRLSRRIEAPRRHPDPCSAYLRGIRLIMEIPTHWCTLNQRHHFCKHFLRDVFYSGLM